MSTVNVAIIRAENLESSNVIVGNTVTLTDISISVGNSTVNTVLNSGSLTLANASYNTTINSTSLSTGYITLNGVDYNGIVGEQLVVDTQIFTNPVAINIWYKPAWVKDDDIVTVTMWGGGGGGNTTTGYGGGGGAYVTSILLASQCNSQCNVVVGAGGGAGVAGGNSAFWTNITFSITAFGGNAANTTSSGGGGGWYSGAGIGVSGGAPVGGNSTVFDSNFGGGAGKTSTANTGGSSIYGGGGGGATTGAGGRSIYGGGGGSGTSGAGGISMIGGTGGNNTVAAAIPGGGGAGQTNLSGARGEVRVTVSPGVRKEGTIPIKYTMTANNSYLVEGSSLLITVTTENVPNNTTLYYTLNNSSAAVATDFTTAVNGSIVIFNNSNSFILTANNDVETANEAFTIDLRTTSSSGPIVSSISSVLIEDREIVLVGNAISSAGVITLPAGIQEGDLVLVAGDDPVSSSGWSTVREFNYKFMSNPPETTLTLSTNPGVGIAAVFRNLHPNTWLDYSSLSGIARNPGSVVSSTANAVIVVYAEGRESLGSIGTITSAPAGYTGLGFVSNSAALVAGMGYALAPTTGTYNPGAFGGSTSPFESGQAIVLRKR